MILTTEIASATIPSDNPIHQRLLYAYEVSKTSGDVLDLGCGEGRGIHLFDYNSYTGIDRNQKAIENLQEKYPTRTFIQSNIPPLSKIEDESFDTVVSFQVIEHIEDDNLFLSEIHRVLRPGGKAILSTPNRPMSLTRNPWHVREYTHKEFTDLLSKHFSSVSSMGIYGNDACMKYYKQNKKNVERFKLQHIKLPTPIYNILNRINRALLSGGGSNITIDDFFLDYADDTCLDLYYTVEK